MKLLSLIMVGLAFSTSAFASQTIYPNNPDIMRIGRVGVSDSGYKADSSTQIFLAELNFS